MAGLVDEAGLWGGGAPPSVLFFIPQLHCIVGQSQCFLRCMSTFDTSAAAAVNAGALLQ
jgi:hypothetical protein